MQNLRKCAAVRLPCSFDNQVHPVGPSDGDRWPIINIGSTRMTTADASRVSSCVCRWKGSGQLLLSNISGLDLPPGASSSTNPNLLNGRGRSSSSLSAWRAHAKYQFVYLRSLSPRQTLSIVQTDALLIPHAATVAKQMMASSNSHSCWTSLISRLRTLLK